MRQFPTLRALAAGAILTTAALGLSACAAPAEPAEGSGANMADVMFVQMMIPHHEGAIEMSDVLLEKTDVDPEVIAVAEQIRAAQAPEIEQMEAWLDEWEVGMPGMSGDDGMDHGGMGGMSDDMDALEEAEGAAAGDLFLEQMIVHHEGAIEMAEDVLDDGRHPEVRELAEGIMSSQADEIEQMRSMLAS